MRRWRHKATCPHGIPWYLTRECTECEHELIEVVAFLPAAAFSGELSGYMVIETPREFYPRRNLPDRIGRSIVQ